MAEMVSFLLGIFYHNKKKIYMQEFPIYFWKLKKSAFPIVKILQNSNY